MDPESFLRISDQFRLGDLPTEQPHPETVGLAEFAQTDLPTAVQAFHRVDQLALSRLSSCLEPLPKLIEAMARTLTGGGHIFLVGCGATGRLALSLETIAREAWLNSENKDCVRSFMAGGDAALIRSIESFEDFPAYGARQLEDAGFGKEDLLIAITEGGETPFVIGACLAAAEQAEEPPWFLFCNPPDLLCETVDRSREVLSHPCVRPFFLDTGPMALAGSTRLQASTIQMLVTGACLSEALGHEAAITLIEKFTGLMLRHDPAEMIPFIENEAAAYTAGNLLLYETSLYGITLLTDTTERAPTFSLAPFENKERPDDPKSWCYLCLPVAYESPKAWEHLLKRKPRALDWPTFTEKASLKTLMGYDISAAAAQWRQARYPEAKQLRYSVDGSGPTLSFGSAHYDLQLSTSPLLLRHLMLKCCLNLQSTLVMGRLGRFESNLMTHVAPSNYKLIDRAARHRQYFHRQKTGDELPYASAVKEVFARLKK